MTATTDPQIPELTDAYRRARRNLTACSAVLLFWEYIGVEVNNATAQSLSLFGMNLGLKNPEVIPSVVFALQVYFLFRLSIEWGLVQEMHRENTQVKADAAVSIIIAAVASALFVFQTSSEMRIAEFIKANMGNVALATAIVSAIVTVFATYVSSLDAKKRKKRHPYRVGSAVTIAAVLITSSFVTASAILFIALQFR